MSKRLYIPLLAAGIVVLSISGAMAKPDKAMDHKGGKYAEGMKRGDCPVMLPEKREAVMQILKEYRRAVAPLKDQLTVKKYELEALSRNPNTQPEMLSKICADIGGLLSQLRTVKENRNVRLESELGFLPRHPDRLAECPVGAVPPAAPARSSSAEHPAIPQMATPEKASAPALLTPATTPAAD